MKRILIYWSILIISFLYACSFDNKTNNANNNRKNIFIIKTDTVKYKTDSISGDTLMYFRQYYSDYNIILFDSITTGFIHKKRFVCYEGCELNNTLPNFEFLKPKYFTRFENISSVLDTILPDSLIAKICIAYNKDTIIDERYFQLKKKISQKKIKIVTRKITEEEQHIVTSLLKNDKYKPENLEWHRTLNVPDREFLIQLRKGE